MHNLRTSSLNFMLLAISLAGVAAALETKVPTVASQNASIFLTEIQRAQPGQGCAQFHVTRVGYCKTKVRARIIRVFKGEWDREAVPAEFEVDIQQIINISAGAPWSDNNIQAGQRYLILSRAEQIGPSVFASALAPVPVTDQDDPVGDLELILNTEPLTLHQQASAVAGALGASGTPHSYFLGRYAAALLAAGSETDTMDLARALEESTDHAFSDFAKHVLLSELCDRSRSAAEPPKSLLNTYIVMTVRYFLLPPKESTLDLPSLRDGILSNHIPWLLNSERAKVLMRAALSPDLRQRLRKQVLSLAADERQRPERRQLMKELLPLIGPN